MMTRRKMIETTAVGMGAVAMGAMPLAACASQPEAETVSKAGARPEPASANDGSSLFEDAFASDAASKAQSASAPAPSIRMLDMHCDTVDELCMHGLGEYRDGRGAGTLVSNNLQIAADRMGDVAWAQCYAVWTPDECPDISYASWYRHGAAYFKAQMAAYPDVFTQVFDWADVDGILDEGKVAAILTVESARILEEGLDIVDEFVSDGVKIASISWNGVNSMAGGFKSDAGLSDYGRQALAALESAGIVFDVSHLNDAGFWDVEAAATKPYIATHSNSRAMCDTPRNLTDDQFRAIVARGGLVGLNYYQAFIRANWMEGDADTGFDETIAHVEHWLDIEGGQDVIALGGDRDGSDVAPWLAGCETQAEFYRLTVERLGQELADKLFYTNARDFFNRYVKA